MSSKKSQAPQKSQKKQPKKAKAPGKAIQFSLSWSGLISWGVISLVVVAWAFILGVLVGRGYQPETFFPLVAQFMPGQSPQEAQGSSDSKQDPVLSAQELGFYDSLQSETGPPPPRPKKRVAQQRSEPEKQPEVEQPPPRSEYVYEYQVGAFKRRAQAEALRRNLSTRGLKTAIEEHSIKGTPWYRVLIRYQGSAQEAQSFTARLRQMGLKNFFLRGKTKS